MGCFVVAEFLLISASRGPSAIAEPLVLKFFLKTVADVRPRVRVTVREKSPDFEFSGTSGCRKVLSRILGDFAVIW